jgi:hypothetical protein
MKMADYKIIVDGEVVAKMSGDFSQASSPILLDGDSTPFQVADFRHRETDAAEGLLLWAWGQGCEIVPVEQDEDGEDVLVYSSLRVE